MKQHLSVSDDFFDLVQKRYIELGPGNDFAGFDPSIITVLQKLNAVKGIATTFSSSGQAPFCDPNNSKKNIYIAMAVDEVGLQKLLTFHSFVLGEAYRQASPSKVQIMDQVPDIHTVMTQAIELKIRMDYTADILTERQMDEWTPYDKIYPSFTLEIQLDNFHSKGFYLDCLECAASMLAKMETE